MSSSDSEDEVGDWLNLGKKILKKGEKDFAPDGSNSQLSVLDQSRSVMYNALQHNRHHGKFTLKGDWDPRIQQTRIESPRGTFLNTMGVFHHGAHYLNPEETLYLVERGSLFLYINGNLASVEAAYAVCLSKTSQCKLLVYFYLRKLGYIVVDAPTEHFDPVLPVTASNWLGNIVPFQTAFAWRRCYSKFSQIYRDLQFIHIYGPPKECQGHLTFHVWKPSTKYRKKAPPAPDFYVKVMNARTESMPTLHETNALFQCIPHDEPKLHKKNACNRIKQGKRTLIVAVVDSGIVSFVKVHDTAFDAPFT